MQTDLSGTVLCVVPTLGTRLEWLTATLMSIASQEKVRTIVRCVAPESEPVRDLCHRMGVEYVRFDKPGLSAAINYGFNSAEEMPDFCMWLGDDDLLAPASLKAATGALLARPDAAFVYGYLRYIDKNGRTLAFSRPTRWAAAYLRYGKNFVPQPGSVMRSQAAAQVGWLDEHLTNAMDQDLFTKLQSWGAAIYLRKELASYRMHEGTITSTKRGKDESLFVRERHRPPAAGFVGKIERRLNQVLSRYFNALTWRMPWPETPRIRSVPYTSADVTAP